MQADYSSFIVMLARQRSGTNAVQAVLESHPAIFCTREVFHDTPSAQEHLDPETSYFRFLDTYPKETLIRARTSNAVQERLFVDYLQFLRARSAKRYIVLDIKYNSTHHFDGPWRAIRARPHLFPLIRRHRLRVLHLTRRNYLRYQLSRMSAQASGQWVVRTDAAPSIDRPRISLAIDQLLNHFRAYRLEDELVAHSFHGYHSYATFDYAELFPRLGEGVSNQFLAAVAKWLGIEDSFSQKAPQYRKLSRLALSEAIDNFDDVAAVLRGTPFEYCLEDEAMYHEPAP